MPPYRPCRITLLSCPCTAVVYVLQGSDCLFSTMGEAQDVRIIVEFGYVKCFCEEG